MPHMGRGQSYSDMDCRGPSKVLARNDRRRSLNAPATAPAHDRKSRAIFFTAAAVPPGNSHYEISVTR